MTRLQSRTLFIGLLLAAILGLLLLNQSGRLEGLKSVLLTPLAALQRGVAGLTGGLTTSLQGGSPDAAALRQENTDLKAQVAQLQKQVVDLQESQADFNLLASLLNYARTQPDSHYAAANVIGRDTSPFLSYVIIDLGSDAGVARDQPVVTDNGLVGTIVEVNCCAAKVRLITDPSSAVNARLQQSRDEGVAVGRFGGGLDLQYLSQQAQVKSGDLVLTSGLGGGYPSGVVIGTVSAVQRQAFDVLQTASITPGVDFNRLEIVLVITNFKPLDLTPFQAPTSTPAAAAP
jgi:rod shape-determining protein MreC